MLTHCFQSANKPLLLYCYYYYTDASTKMIPKYVYNTDTSILNTETSLIYNTNLSLLCSYNVDNFCACAHLFCSKLGAFCYREHPETLLPPPSSAGCPTLSVYMRKY